MPDLNAGKQGSARHRQIDCRQRDVAGVAAWTRVSAMAQLRISVASPGARESHIPGADDSDGSCVTAAGGIAPMTELGIGLGSDAGNTEIPALDTNVTAVVARQQTTPMPQLPGGTQPGSRDNRNGSRRAQADLTSQIAIRLHAQHGIQPAMSDHCRRTRGTPSLDGHIASEHTVDRAINVKVGGNSGRAVSELRSRANRRIAGNDAQRVSGHIGRAETTAYRNVKC